MYESNTLAQIVITWYGAILQALQLFHQCSVLSACISVKTKFADSSQEVEGGEVAWTRREEGVDEKGGDGGDGGGEGGGGGDGGGGGRYEVAKSSAITDGRSQTTNKTTLVWELVKFTPSIYL